MFSMMRGALGGWIAKLFLALLVISFAVWGVSGSMFAGVGNSVVTAGKTEVGLLDYRLAYERQLGLISRQMGQRITTEQARAFGVEQSVTSQIVAGAVLDEEARRMGLGVSEDRLAELITQDDAFKDASGSFSRAQLEAVLRSIGMPQDAYIESQKNNAIRQQIIEAATMSVSMPQAFVDQLAQIQGEKRTFELVNITPEAIAEKPEPTEDQLTAWYDENKNDYRAPEYRKLIVVKLEAEDITDEAGVTDDELKARYEKDKVRYTNPEKREVRQIVFPDKAAADAAAAKIAAGTTFEEMAAEMNLSPVDLGLVERAAIPDQKIADAAFSIEGTGTSGVVEGIFGPVILQVVRVEPESLKPLQEVSGELRKTIALEKADEHLYDTHDRLEDERAAGETLTNAAKNVGLVARTIDAVDLTGRDLDGNIVKDIPESQKLLSEAFQTDEGVEADPISIGSRGFAWYEVAGVTPDRQKEFDEVREQVRSDWIAAETVKAVEALAETVRDRVAGGETLAAVASELLPANSLGQMIEPETVGPVKRTENPDALTPEALREGFRNARDSVFVAQGKPENSKAVIVVSGIDASSPEAAPGQVTNQLNGALADDIIATMVNQMQDGMTVTVNPQAISAAIANQ
jgi:peptidyl-prolyl cis-trans isomerase D